MNVADYFQLDSGVLSFEPERASDFAKQVAGDFNPLHSTDNKRFCVPGDLLFSVLMHQYGLSSSVSVQFAGMLDGTSAVNLPAELNGVTHIQDARERDVLVVACSGEKTEDRSFIARLCEQYVKFSGETFPGVLQPLMMQHDVMINPTRPLVIYQSMQLAMNTLEGSDLSVEMTQATLSVEGKKGTVELAFNLKDGSDSIGTGSKLMLLGGLRAYDAKAMQTVVDDYNALKFDG